MIYRANKRTCRRRRGFTIIELLVVITVGSVILGISVTTLALLLSVYQTDRTESVYLATQVRLARQFRTDVAEAKELTKVDVQAGHWQLDMPDGTAVSYQASEHGVLWTRHAGEKITARDRFPLPPGASWHIRQMPRNPSQRFNLVQLQIDAPSDQETGGLLRRHRTVAALATDHRFTSRPEN